MFFAINTWSRQQPSRHGWRYKYTSANEWDGLIDRSYERSIFLGSSSKSLGSNGGRDIWYQKIVGHWPIYTVYWSKLLIYCIEGEFFAISKWTFLVVVDLKMLFSRLIFVRSTILVLYALMSGASIVMPLILQFVIFAIIAGVIIANFALSLSTRWTTVVLIVGCWKLYILLSLAPAALFAIESDTRCAHLQLSLIVAAVVDFLVLSLV